MKKKLFLVFCSFSAIVAYAQKNTIKGIVKDSADQHILIGAVVENETTHTKKLTNADGHFLLNGQPGDKLKITFIGYSTKEITIENNQPFYEVYLPTNNESLSDVVVTGAFGLKYSAKEMGVSVATVSGKSVNNTKVINPLQGLQAKVAGLQINMFDASVNPQVRVTLRGARNIDDGKNEPLFVVDGVPLPSITQYNPQSQGSTRDASAITSLNPNDIESITVLKGANAAAVYGSQGVNGVIIVTTKHGSKGAGRINFTHSTTFDKVGWLPKFQEEFGGGWNGVYQPYETRSWGAKYDGSTVNVGPILPDGTQWQLKYSPIKNQKSQFFNTGITNQESLSLSGGDDKSSYYLSGQYADVEGVIPHDNNKKTNFRFSGSRKFGKLLSSYSVSYSQMNVSTTTSEPWNNVRNLPLYIPIKDLKDYKNPTKYYAHPEYYFASNSINPYWGLDNMRQDARQENINGNVSFEYPITSWFKAIYRLGFTSVNSKLHAFNAKVDNSAIPYTYYDADGKLQTLKLTNGTFGPRLSAAGSVQEGTTSDQQLNSDLLLQFTKTFKKFSTRLLLGQNYQDQKSSEGSTSASALNMPEVYNLSNAVGNLSGNFNSYHQRRYSFFGEFMVGYDNYLFLTLNGRQENVSVLSPDNRSYFYPGANLSFVFTNAFPELKNSILSYGKVYGSWSKTANSFVDPYRLQNVYSQVAGFPFGNLNGTQITTTNANPDLKPEFVYSWETGMQLGFWKDRIRFEATYAHADSRDQIMEISSSAASGFLSTFTNAARMRSKSIELNLQADLIRNETWLWTIGANYTHNDNTVVSIAGNEAMINQWKGLYIVPGQRYPTYEMPAYETDPQGRTVVNATTGIPIQSSELKNMGTSQPVHMLGVNTSITYKNITFSALVDARWGSNYYTAAAENTTAQGLAPITSSYDRGKFIYPNSVIKNADGTYSENTTEATSDYNFWNTYKSVLSNNVFNGKYIKLRELNITYSFPAKWLGGQTMIKGVSVSAVARNLINIRAKDNIWGEPENIYQSGVGFSGWRTLPSTRTYGFSVSVNL
ncbi:SusC/RagA family TonB-linked outer membrane protein [Rhizosphaericola mali]|uniref:SusC/RagA family TonB-linked outer membrane protein n=1 Tax=Rhizosphaericola mali TaxID=2545455 RepID=A0A5P2FXT8_9BACT|nr:SusC/RagA family TonB-linked outer membrane protein [Rhizosphaericola mali]QES87757.1 SusC/RagA family TonB-linked outer membrane protein [Rhizosphaericola mali]